MKLNPGSDAAIKAGCTCPASDNARGMGAWGTRGDEAVFWIKQDCRLHGSDKGKRMIDERCAIEKSENVDVGMLCVVWKGNQDNPRRLILMLHGLCMLSSRPNEALDEVLFLADMLEAALMESLNV